VTVAVAVTVVMKDLRRFAGALAVRVPRRRRGAGGAGLRQQAANNADSSGTVPPREETKDEDEDEDEKRRKKRKRKQEPQAEHSTSAGEQDSKHDALQGLDDIFSSIKQRKSESSQESGKAKESSRAKQAAAVDQSYGLVQSSGSASSIISPNPPVHRFDQATGLPVYKYTALLVGDGGGTPLCPFDCQCCF
jgi:hypothetical protein